jgi:excisionase family DNA binding protein
MNLINKKQMAQKLCVTARTLENWMREGFVPYIKIGRCVRYDLEDVMAALKRRHGRNMSSDAFRV